MTSSERVIAVDAMGGDLAPEAVCLAAASLSRSTDIRLLLTGHKRRLDALLDRHRADRDRLEVRHCSDAIAMDEDPRASLSRTSSSLALALDAVRSGEAEAVVSAGNTGALLLHAARRIPRVPGIRRAALAAVYPTRPRPHNPDPFALIVDVGANLSARPEDLLQFATMGSAYAARVSKIERPHVGLLNIGEEGHKGDSLLRDAHQLLCQASGLHFVGNIEGKDVPAGRVDVVVCPGVIGNVVLKLLEGVGEVVLARGEDVFRERLRWRLGRWLLRDGVARLSRFFDYTSYGGAPILGLEHIVIKAHGRSNARALENAVKVAAKAARDGVCGAIAAGIASQDAS
jgi:glycerol-3-phosphate acyltransferase PlsX